MLILAWTSIVWAPSIIDLTSRNLRYRWPAVASVAATMIVVFSAIYASYQSILICESLEEFQRTVCWKENAGMAVITGIAMIIMILAALLTSVYLLIGCLSGHNRETRKVAH